jgi:hypothetical protein
MHLKPKITKAALQLTIAGIFQACLSAKSKAFCIGRD